MRRRFRGLRPRSARPAATSAFLCRRPRRRQRPDKASVRAVATVLRAPPGGQAGAGDRTDRRKTGATLASCTRRSIRAGAPTGKKPSTSVSNSRLTIPTSSPASPFVRSTRGRIYRTSARRSSSISTPQRRSARACIAPSPMTLASVPASSPTNSIVRWRRCASCAIPRPRPSRTMDRRRRAYGLRQPHAAGDRRRGRARGSHPQRRMDRGAGRCRRLRRQHRRLPDAMDQ